MDANAIKREFFAGGTAGSIGILIGFPFDLIKVKLQAYPDQYKSAWSCLTATLKADGITGLYRGCIPPVLMQGLVNSLMFTGESTARKILEPNLQPGEVGSRLNTFLAGAAGGLLQCVVLVPAEVIKCAMQANTLPLTGVSATATTKPQARSAFTDTVMSVQYIYRTEGVRGFYKGLSATAARDVPAIGTYFFIYKNSRDFIATLEGTAAQKKQPSSFATLMSGGIAGCLSWTLIYPFDVIKTSTQVAAKSAVGDNVKSYAEMPVWQVAHGLYRQHGIRVFYRGLGTAVLRAFPVNASTFYFYEHFKVLLHTT